MSSLNIVYVPIGELKPATYNPRKWNDSQIESLKESITRFGLVDPIIANNAPERKNVVIGGHFRLNKNLGEFDFALLKDFSEEFLADIGFSTEELDDIFEIDPAPEKFDLK